ncbi:hypothetical protein [Bacillus salipaludis]|uniref:hypothetical protein n=1 Tax=Bacillus salipaludis TaxID=2547811 RepID=UPI0014055B86|nr:hypothetical protein [Bacillus salipaludis]
MIWLILLTPFVILGGIAVYFDKKYGSTPPDESKLAEKPDEVINPMQNMNHYGPL